MPGELCARVGESGHAKNEIPDPVEQEIGARQASNPRALCSEGSHLYCGCVTG